MEKLSCTQMKCQWILPHFVKDVEYSRMRDIIVDIKSAQTLKSVWQAKCSNIQFVQFYIQAMDFTPLCQRCRVL